MLAATLANLILIPRPRWFAMLGVVGVCAGVLAAGKLVGASSAR